MPCHIRATSLHPSVSQIGGGRPPDLPRIALRSGKVQHTYRRKDKARKLQCFTLRSPGVAGPSNGHAGKWQYKWDELKSIAINNKKGNRDDAKTDQCRRQKRLPRLAPSGNYQRWESQ